MGVNTEAISRDGPTSPLKKRSLMVCLLMHMPLGIAQYKGILPPNLLLQILLFASHSYVSSVKLLSAVYWMLWCRSMLFQVSFTLLFSQVPSLFPAPLLCTFYNSDHVCLEMCAPFQECCSLLFLRLFTSFLGCKHHYQAPV